jgi:glyoxylase-like metal-dependent hydrolase (beta-lactamase superfamily II)
VTDVVLTHLHMDQVGGLLVDGVRDRLRPDLRVHLAAAEAKFWESELAANRESLVATHLSFPSVCHVAVNGDVFRWVPGPWEY